MASVSRAVSACASRWLIATNGLPAAQAMDSHYERAFRLLQSEKTRQALDLTAEPAGDLPEQR